MDGLHSGLIEDEDMAAATLPGSSGRAIGAEPRGSWRSVRDCRRRKAKTAMLPEICRNVGT